MIHKLSGIQDMLDYMFNQIRKLTDPASGHELLPPSVSDIHVLIDDYHHINPWLTDTYIRKSLNWIGAGLRYGLKSELFNSLYSKNKTIALIINPGAPLEEWGKLFSLQ